MADEELNEKQKAFCRHYITEWNATKSYIDAYGVESENTAAVSGYHLLRNPKVQAYIKEIQQDLEKIAGISRLKVLQEHAKLAFSSIAHLHDSWIERKEFDKLTDDQKSCIAEISTQIRKISIEGEETPINVEFVKIKLYDKQKALDAISRMMGYDSATKIDHTTKGEKINDVSLLSTEELISRVSALKDLQNSKQ